MIFAAGFGTRMMPLTRDRPKPMIELAGRPMIDYAIELARNAGADKLALNVHYKGDVLRHHLQSCDIALFEEQPDILDTGGGLRNALPHLGTGAVWTLNPDAVWQGPNPLAFAADHWNAEKMDALLVCISPERAVGRIEPGDFHIDAHGRVMRGGDAIYGGVQIINTDRLFEIPERVFSLNRLWDLMIEEDRCSACMYPGTWCDLGHPGALQIGEKMLSGGRDV